MGVKAELVFQGNRLGISLRKIRRADLYGSHRRIALDARERECDSALMTRDGRFLFGIGGLAGLYQDENGDVVDGKDRIAASDGADAKTCSPIDDGNPPELSVPIPADALLEHLGTDLYLVEGIDLEGSLMDSLAKGDIYEMPFPRRGPSDNKTAFLLANEHGVFIVKVSPARFDFIGREAPIVVEEDPFTEIDDIGFDEWRGER